MTREFTRRGFLAWVSTGRPPDELKNEDHFSLKNSNLRLNLRTIFQSNKDIKQTQDDDEIWLARTGLVKYNPENGQNMPKRDIISNRVPVENTETIQLQDPASLKQVVRPIIDRYLPSLSYYLKEDSKEERSLFADSSIIPQEGGGVQVLRKPVKIIYAMAKPGDISNSTAGLTRMRVSGDEVEYAIIIRLNPMGVYFDNQRAFKNWIQSVYVHEMVHVKQKEMLWDKLLRDSLVKKRYPTQGEIFSILDNPANIINNEALAYWAGMSYAQMIQPGWFTSGTSPDFTGLKKPFLKLKAKGMDPLIDGERTNHHVYDEKALEILWLNAVFFNIDHEELVRLSKIEPRLVSTIEVCNREGLITNREFEEYLKQVNTYQAMAYLKQRELHHDPNFRLWSALGTTAAIAGLGITSALLFRMFGRMRE